VPGVLQRLLTRSGILPILRQQWRDDQAAAGAKLERRFDKQLASLTQQIDRLSALAEQLQKPADNDATAERVAALDRTVRLLHATLRINLADQHRNGDRSSHLDHARVAAHVERAIAATTLETDPSVHVLINDLMPADTYQAILDGIPPSVFFTQKDNVKQNLKLRHLDVAPDSAIEIFSFLENDVIPKMMVPALLRRFAPHIREFYIREYGPDKGELLAQIPHQASGGRMMLRRAGYHLDPHLDPKRVVFTTLIYFARPGDSEAWGTGFYRMNGTPKIDRTNTFYPGTQGIQCDLVKLVPFRPNSAVAFLNWGGAHGADIPKDAPKNLERYSFQFYVSPDADALAALTGETDTAVME
jgi:hypothetical protein